jgi:hypothetical protein
VPKTIPNAAGISALSELLFSSGCPLASELIEALSLLLESNYFDFNDQLYLQLCGCPMGFPHSPCFASLYLHYHERPIARKYSALAVFFKRYLDDVLIVLRPSSGLQYSCMLEELNSTPGMNFTGPPPSLSVDFLDVTLSIANGSLITKTFEKKLNLHLYSAANSSQPKGVLKGIIYGLIKNYRNHNTLRYDFLEMANKLHDRLVQRGHISKNVKRLIAQRVAQLDSEASQIVTNAPPGKGKCKKEKIFYIVPFDENGPSRCELRKLLRLKELEELFEQHYGKEFSCVIGYRNPPSLHRRLGFNKL